MCNRNKAEGENEELQAVKRHSYKEVQSTPPQKWKFDKSHSQEFKSVINIGRILREKQQMK